MQQFITEWISPKCIGIDTWVSVQGNPTIVIHSKNFTTCISPKYIIS